jgi:hypothetical protein
MTMTSSVAGILGLLGFLMIRIVDPSFMISSSSNFPIVGTRTSIDSNGKYPGLGSLAHYLVSRTSREKPSTQRNQAWDRKVIRKCLQR